MTATMVKAYDENIRFCLALFLCKFIICKLGPSLPEVSFYVMTWAVNMPGKKFWCLNVGFHGQ